MGVAEGVDVENVDVGRSEEKILDKGREHVPRIEEQEGYDKPEKVRRCKGDDESIEN